MAACRRLTTLALLLVLAGAVGLGCAKYNLFYNAETAFSEAEEMAEGADPRNLPTSGQRPKYQRCIQKCRLLLEEYPNSDYIDDALFLIGKSHYRLREWSEAIVEFDNVLANFPNTPFLEETMYLKSLAHISRGEEKVGLEWFGRLRESFPEGRFGTEALYRLGDAYAEDERYDDAIRYYRQFLEEHPDHEEAPEVKRALAQTYYDSERYEEAQEVLAELDSERMEKSAYFEALWLRLSALTELGRYEEAAAGLEELESAAQKPGEEARMMLLTGRIQLGQGDEDEGVFTLETLAEDFEGRDLEFEARSEIVEYLLEEEGPEGEEFRAQLEVALDGRPRGEFGDDIRARGQQVKDYDRYKEAYDRGDSTAHVHAFKLAELLLVNFERPDDAEGFYRIVLEEAPDSRLAPRAAYAIGYIEREHHHDSEAASEAFQFVQERYPESLQARALAGEMFLEAKAPTSLDSTRVAMGTPDVSRPARDEGDARRTGRARLQVDWPLRRGGPGAFHGRGR